MSRTIVSKIVLVALVLAVPAVALSQGAAVQPGGGVGGMTLRSGGVAGPPLWAFCSPAFLNPGVTTTSCAVPPLPELAIGHGWFSADEALRDSNWAAMSWTLSLDGQPIDLPAFGWYNGDLPVKGLPGHGADEEVITKLRSWDVVLVNPTAGPHTLHSVLTVSQEINDGFHTTPAGVYELEATFTVQVPGLPQTGGAVPDGAPSLWILAGGVAALLAGLGLRRAAGRAR